MARKKGRDITGWLIVDKPAGVTSTAVVNKVRWALDAKKAGHAGTLDPDATGVLAVALGEATKTAAILTDALKCYDFTVNWGAETTTDDASGQDIGLGDGVVVVDGEELRAMPGQVEQRHLGGALGAVDPGGDSGKGHQVTALAQWYPIQRTADGRCGHGRLLVSLSMPRLVTRYRSRGRKRGLAQAGRSWPRSSVTMMSGSGRLSLT